MWSWELSSGLSIKSLYWWKSPLNLHNYLLPKQYLIGRHKQILGNHTFWSMVLPNDLCLTSQCVYIYSSLFLLPHPWDGSNRVVLREVTSAVQHTSVEWGLVPSCRCVPHLHLLPTQRARHCFRVLPVHQRDWHLTGSFHGSCATLRPGW